MDGDQLAINYGIAALICIGLISLIYYGHNNRVNKGRAWAEAETPRWQELWGNGIASTIVIVVMEYSFQVSLISYHRLG